MTNFEEIERVLRPHKDALKTELQSWQTPMTVEQNLLAAFEQQFPKRPWYRRWPAFSWEFGGGLCASLLLLFLLLNQTSLWQLIPGRELALHGSTANGNAANGSAASEAQTNVDGAYDMHEDIPFMALYSGEEILQQEEMRIVQAQIPNAVLATMGVTVNPEVANQSAKAEVLVGANDEFLAVRFLPN